MNRTEKQFNLLNSLIIFILLLTVFGMFQTTPDTKLTSLIDFDGSFSIHNVYSVPDVNLQEETTFNSFSTSDDNRFYNELFLLSCLLLTSLSSPLSNFWIRIFRQMFDIAGFHRIIKFILRKDGKKYDAPLLSNLICLY